jgi:hypothetical protein
MTAPLDDLFAPERLRRSWSEEPPAAPPAPPPEPPLVAHARLCALARERFPGPRGEPLLALLAQLGELLARRFPPGDRPPADAAALGTRIAKLLNSIEDLADALVVGGRRR